MADPIKHHFLPVFYLKNWCAHDGKIVEFSIPFDVVKPKRVHPRGTGYINRLYAIGDLPESISYEIEKNFLSPVDSRAAITLAAFIGGREVTVNERQAWSHFMMTLLMRTPAEIALLKEFARKLNAEIGRSLFDVFQRHTPVALHNDIEQGFLEFNASIVSRSVAQILRIMSTEEIVDRISQMEWHVLDIGATAHEFLTSDKPVVVVRNDRTAGNTVIALPIAPRKLFIAATAKSLIKELQNTNPKKISEAMNGEVVGGANKLVYGRSDSQLSFIAKRLGKIPTPSFVEGILKEAGVSLESMVSYFLEFNDSNIREEIEEILERHSHRK